MTAPAAAPDPLIATVVEARSVGRPRRCPVSVSIYELRVHPFGTSPYERTRRVPHLLETLASTTSGSGCPAWLHRAADRIVAARPETVAAARAIADAVYASRHRERRRVGYPTGTPRAPAPAETLIADPGWQEATPISPEETLAAAGIDGPRQAAYQRKMSTLLGAGGGA